MAYTTDELVASVQVGAMIPTASDTITSAVILGWSDEERASVIDPWRRQILGTEHAVASESQSLVSGTATYRIPWRASGASLHSVSFVDANGDEWPMNRIPLDESGAYVEGAGYHWESQYAYAIEGDFVRVLPTPTASSGSLKLRYPRRPSRHVLIASAMLLTGVTPTTSPTSTTYSGVAPASFTTSTPLDVIQAKPNFDLFALDQTPGGISAGVSLYVLGSTPSEVAAGDYLALAGETPIIQLPVELHPVLIALTIGRALEATGDREGMAASYTRAYQRLSKLEPLFRERVGNGRRYAVDKHSMVRAGRYR